MESPGVCHERMDLLDVWSKAMSDQVRAVKTLGKATSRVTRPEYDALFQELQVLQEETNVARAAYEGHMLRHGCAREDGLQHACTECMQLLGLANLEAGRHSRLVSVLPKIAGTGSREMFVRALGETRESFRLLQSAFQTYTTHSDQHSHLSIDGVGLGS
jgi:hypothetical protein